MENNSNVNQFRPYFCVLDHDDDYLHHAVMEVSLYIIPFISTTKFIEQRKFTYTYIFCSFRDNLNRWFGREKIKGIQYGPFHPQADLQSLPAGPLARSTPFPQCSGVSDVKVLATAKNLALSLQTGLRM